MPGLHLGCCELSAPEVRDRVFVLDGQPDRGFHESAFIVPKPSHFREALEARPESSVFGGKQADRPGWQGWFEGWEGRQHAVLQHHQASTKELIEALRRELLEKFDQMERGGGGGVDMQHVISMGAGIHQLFSEPYDNGCRGEDTESFKRVPSPFTPFTPFEAQQMSGDVPISGDIPKTKLNDMHDAVFHVVGLGNENKQASMTSAAMETPIEHCLASFFAGAGAALKSVQGEDSANAPRCLLRLLLWKVVHNSAFTCLIGAIIVFYTLVTGAITDIEMRAAILNEETPLWRYRVDTAFTVIFLLELCMRIIADGCGFFVNKEWEWNVYDLIVCFFGILDTLKVFDANLSFLRVVRALKTLRVLRVIRVFRFFKELRLMVASIVCCLASLTWAASFLVVLTYLFAVLLLQGASEFLRHSSPADNEELHRIMAQDFGSILRAMYSLTLAVSGGRSWGEFAEPFISISPAYGALFTLFVIFVTFGALNILTGIFVESTSSVVSYDKELAILDEMARNESVVAQIRALFKELDVDCSGMITPIELQKNLQDERVRAYFSLLQMDVSEATGLFRLLDRDESGEVSIDEFIMTCLRLKGSAKSLDLAGMLFESKRFHNFVKCNMEAIKQSVHDLQACLKVLRAAATAFQAANGGCSPPASLPSPTASRSPGRAAGA